VPSDFSGHGSCCLQCFSWRDLAIKKNDSENRLKNKLKYCFRKEPVFTFHGTQHNTGTLFSPIYLPSPLPICFQAPRDIRKSTMEKKLEEVREK